MCSEVCVCVWGGGYVCLGCVKVLRCIYLKANLKLGMVAQTPFFHVTLPVGCVCVCVCVSEGGGINYFASEWY